MRFPHDLQEEFPDLNGLIERLIKTNYEFGPLAAAYDEVNGHIWRVESEEEPTTDEALEKLKKRSHEPMNHRVAFYPLLGGVSV